MNTEAKKYLDSILKDQKEQLEREIDRSQKELKKKVNEKMKKWKEDNKRLPKK